MFGSQSLQSHHLSFSPVNMISHKTVTVPVSLYISRYYISGVKLEQNVSVPTITPAELAALQSVLSLTQHILSLDEDLRTTMAENNQWHIVSTLFGLLSCPVVPQLKGLFYFLPVPRWTFNI